MKKFVSTFLALAMCMALAIPAMATDYGSQTATDYFGQTLSFSSAKAETREITFDWFGEISKSTESVLVVQPGSTVIAKDSSGNEIGFSYTAYGKENGAYVPLDGISPYFGNDSIGYPKVDALFGQQEGWAIPVEMVSVITKFDPATGESSELYIVLGDGSSAPTEPEKPAAPVFTDVAETDYFYKPVKWAVANSITSGTSATTFSPNKPCTKAEILTFIWKASGSPDPDLEILSSFANYNPYPDLNGNEYYFKAAQWAYTKGMASGGMGFGGNEPCSRSLAMSYLWELAGRPTPKELVTFTDILPAIHNLKAISWGVEQNITSGTGNNTFSPDQTCTRGQIMTFLYKSLAQ